MVLRPSEDLDALFLPPRNPNVERWTGPKFGPGEEAAADLVAQATEPLAAEHDEVEAKVFEIVTEVTGPLPFGISLD